VQIDIERFVGDPHCTATQLDRIPVFARHELIVLKSLVCLDWYRLERILNRRLAGLNPTGKTPAKQTYWTEFHLSR
jgi:hypothetical protein